MSRTLEPVSRVGRVTFELDRFELTDGDCYELQGRWFGVRGRRFIRPTLTMLGDGHSTRLLADLKDKPWAAEDGEPWRAAFPSGAVEGEIEEAELAVAPDISVMLSSPNGDAPNGRSRGASARRLRTSARREKPARQPATPPSSQRPATTERLEEMRAELADALEDQRRLRTRLERADEHRRDAAARLDELLGQLSQAIRERDQAQASGEEARSSRAAAEQERDKARRQLAALRRERDDLTAERDAAVWDRDDALQASQVATVDREAAAADRGSALAAGAQAQSERDAALQALDHAVHQRDAALQMRDQVVHERDAALLDRDAAARDLATARGTAERLQSQISHQASTHGAALVMRRAVDTPPAFRRESGLIPRALAIIGLMAVVVVLLIVLRVV